MSEHPREPAPDEAVAEVTHTETSKIFDKEMEARKAELQFSVDQVGVSNQAELDELEAKRREARAVREHLQNVYNATAEAIKSDPTRVHKSGDERMDPTEYNPDKAQLMAQITAPEEAAKAAASEDEQRQLDARAAKWRTRAARSYDQNPLVQAHEIRPELGQDKDEV